MFLQKSVNYEHNLLSNINFVPMKWYFFILAIIVCCLSSCIESKQQKAPNKASSVQKSESGERMHPKYPHIPLAERGVTVVSEEGWTADQMDFQISYCISTVSNIQEISPAAFCECFLGKVQYYYEPRFARDAYQDQQKWNQECFADAQQ